MRETRRRFTKKFAVRKISLSSPPRLFAALSPRSKQMWLLLRHSNSLSVPAITFCLSFLRFNPISNSGCANEKRAPYRYSKQGFSGEGGVEHCHATIGDPPLDLLWIQYTTLACVPWHGISIAFDDKQVWSSHYPYQSVKPPVI